MNKLFFFFRLSEKNLSTCTFLILATVVFQYFLKKNILEDTGIHIYRLVSFLMMIILYTYYIGFDFHIVKILKTFKVVFLVQILSLFIYLSVFTYNACATHKYQKFIFVYYSKYQEEEGNKDPNEQPLTQDEIYRKADHILWCLILFQLLYLVMLIHYYYVSTTHIDYMIEKEIREEEERNIELENRTLIDESFVSGVDTAEDVTIINMDFTEFYDEEEEEEESQSVLRPMLAQEVI